MFHLDFEMMLSEKILLCCWFGKCISEPGKKRISAALATQLSRPSMTRTLEEKGEPVIYVMKLSYLVVFGERCLDSDGYCYVEQLLSMS